MSAVRCGMRSKKCSAFDGAQSSSIPVVPCAHATTGRPPSGLGTSGATTTPEVSTVLPSIPVETYRILQALEPVGAPFISLKLRRSPGFRPGSSTGPDGMDFPGFGGSVPHAAASRTIPVSQARTGERLLQERFQSRVALAADGHTRAVRENGDVAPLRVGLEPLEAVQADQMGAVDTHEALRIERGRQRREGLRLQIGLSFASKPDVVVLRHGGYELFDGDDVHAAAVAHHDPLEPGAFGTRGCGDGRGRRRRAQAP